MTPATALATTQPGPVPAPAKYTVRNLLNDRQQDILAALPKHITPSYFMRVVLTAVQKTPKLAECTPMSFLGAVLQCAQLGLVPDGFLGQAYLIPYENSYKAPNGQWVKRLECQFQAGYRGLITLARRSGEISTVSAEVVHAKDQFEHQRGLDPRVVHKPYDGDDDPGPLTHVYAWYRLKDGGYDLCVMNRRQVHKIREKSQAYKTAVKYQKTADTPWVAHEEWMWKKTALKQLTKLAPLSIEVQRIAGLDDAAEAGLPQDLHLLADPNGEATPIDELETDIDTIEMPQRTSDAAATSGGGAAPGAGESPVSQSASAPRASAPPSTLADGWDRLTEVRKMAYAPGGPENPYWWVATTERTGQVFTTHQGFGAKLDDAFAHKLAVRLQVHPKLEAQGSRLVTVETA